MKTTIAVLAATLLTCSFGAHALVISSTDSGWYNEEGTHAPNIDNYFVGSCDDCDPALHNNFFVFDLTGIESVRSAVLRVSAGVIISDGTYDMFDVQTDVATLVAGGSGLVNIYDDLGSGISFGSIELVTTQSDLTLEISLNHNAINSINASTGGLWAFGGSSMSPMFGAFGFTSSAHIRQLIVQPVPIPGALVLFASGLLGLGFTLRQKNT